MTGKSWLTFPRCAWLSIGRVGKGQRVSYQTSSLAEPCCEETKHGWTMTLIKKKGRIAIIVKPTVLDNSPKHTWRCCHLHDPSKKYESKPKWNLKRQNKKKIVGKLELTWLLAICNVTTTLEKCRKFSYIIMSIPFPGAYQCNHEYLHKNNENMCL